MSIFSSTMWAKGIAQRQSEVYVGALRSVLSMVGRAEEKEKGKERRGGGEAYSQSP